MSGHTPEGREGASYHAQICLDTIEAFMTEVMEGVITVSLKSPEVLSSPFKSTLLLISNAQASSCSNMPEAKGGYM